MTDLDRLALLRGADHPAHRPRRTLTGALLTVVLVLGLLLAIESPVLVAASAALLAGSLLAGRRLRTHLGRRRRPRRLCLPGTGVCVQI